ncbi:YicC/YloC family endoribonuclease [Emcibacter sp.]|uniref:YicC/YloC family endoribonuclease n=1 Tax=Emcibacter sp. TaxID=1979954 RepID=UPI002AA936D5|nr:YicC/YloC family endoribonuclease [Emcibacter sp.]
MTLSSMTGFARTQGQWENYSWVWEIRSVNGRGLDIRCRIPSGFEAMDQTVRGHLKKHIARGSLNVNLQMHRESEEVQVKVNQVALDQLVAIVVETSSNNHLPQPDISNLMSVRDLVQIIEGEEDENFRKARDKAIEESFLEAIAALKENRLSEGAATSEMLQKIIIDIEASVAEATKVAAGQPNLIRDRFMDKVNALLDDNKGLDPDRIAQEVTILATKADVKEEMDRLVAHIDAARKLLVEKEPVGRKLDFLSQEFNREANTLCSKSSDIALTQIGLSLKASIDQLKEQVQNIE